MPVKKRYLYKLFSGFIGFLFNFVSQAIIPRGLGPEVYGNYSFLTNFFIQLTSFVDAGTSICFYTKLSQRPKEQGLVFFYFLFGGIIFVLTVLFVVLLVEAKIYPVIWPNQEVLFIYLALGLGFFMWFAKIINQMTDAYGLTVPAEILKILQKFLAAMILLALFLRHQLDLKNLFIYNYIIWAIFVILLLMPILKNGYLSGGIFKNSVRETKGYLKEFWKYSHPILSFSLVAFVAGIFDRWLLQVYSGSAQQGFYSLAYQIGAICFLFTGAMTPLFMRELTIAHAHHELEKMRLMFRRYVPLLYAITAFFSCFLAVEADKVVYIFGGSRFSGAGMVVAIMAFYPMHQTYGQLSGSVFYATARTKIYCNICIFLSLLGLPITYFFIAPTHQMGMHAGAVGLAIKMVAMNIIGVNVLLYFNAKQLGFNFWRYFAHQITIVWIFLTLAIVANLMATFFLYGRISIFFAAGFLYSVMAITMVYFFPVILGICRKDIDTFICELRKKVFSMEEKVA